MGTDSQKAHTTMHNGGRMMKILKLPSFILSLHSLLVHLARRQKFTFLREHHCTFGFGWLREMRKNGGAIECY